MVSRVTNRAFTSKAFIPDAADEKTKRFQILVSLMLSSQTKDGKMSFGIVVLSIHIKTIYRNNIRCMSKAQDDGILTRKPSKSSLVRGWEAFSPRRFLQDES